MTQQARHFTATVTETVRLNYLLYLPPDYDPQTPMPLLMFLHGMGERGDDPATLTVNGLPRLIAEGQHFPFIIVSPQCPTGSYWHEHVSALNALLDEIIATHAVDTSRVYLTGLSMGGAGTWFLASRYPERFAAIAPVCPPNGIKWMVRERLTQTPIWIFHGDADPSVPIADSQFMVDALQELGISVKFTVYPGVGHNCWDLAYATPELYTWFLSHRLGERDAQNG